MKTFIVAILLLSSTAFAEIRDLNTMMKKASSEETKDLIGLLSSVSLSPTKNKNNGKLVFKVTKIEKGSFWEKQGLKVGDLVTQ